MMGSRQVGLLSTVVLLILGFDCGNCNTQENGKVVSIRSNAANGIGDSESVLHRDRRATLNSIEIQQALDDHNRVRRLVGASDAEKMTWNNDLATLAENWAKNCLYEHDASLKDRNTGQNIYAISGVQSIDITAAIQAWYNEKPFYNYNTLECQSGQQCGHYTQVVWANSREVGCGYWSCSQLSKSNFTTAALILVCDYSPAGNIIGQKPFQMGTGCSRCSTGSWWCNEGLCDLGSCSAVSPTCGCAPVCLNFGSVNTGNCSCSCAPGWYGSDCSVVCEDKDSMCDPKPNQYGYPPSYCTRNDYGPTIREKCPKMCNQCQAAGNNNNNNNYSTSMKPSLLNMLSVWLSWLLIYSFRSV